MYRSLLRITLYSCVFAGRKSNSHQNFWLVRFWDEWWRTLLGSRYGTYGTLLTRKDQNHFSPNFKVQYLRRCLKPMFMFVKKKLGGSLTRYRTYRNLCCNFRKMTPCWHTEDIIHHWEDGSLWEWPGSIDLVQVFPEKRKLCACHKRHLMDARSFPFTHATHTYRIHCPTYIIRRFKAHGTLSLVAG